MRVRNSRDWRRSVSREAEQQQQDNNGGSDNSGSDSDNSGSNNGGSTTGSGQFIWPVSGPITDYFGPRESPTAGASSIIWV